MGTLVVLRYLGVKTVIMKRLRRAVRASGLRFRVKVWVCGSLGEKSKPFWPLRETTQAGLRRDYDRVVLSIQVYESRSHLGSHAVVISHFFCGIHP